jgi:hypothetical protein
MARVLRGGVHVTENIYGSRQFFEIQAAQPAIIPLIGKRAIESKVIDDTYIQRAEYLGDMVIGEEGGKQEPASLFLVRTHASRDSKRQEHDLKALDDAAKRLAAVTSTGRAVEPVKIEAMPSLSVGIRCIVYPQDIDLTPIAPLRQVPSPVEVA